jgi:hypothetical protein
MMFSEFNTFMYEYCIEKKLIINEITDINILNKKTTKLLTDFEYNIKDTEDIEMSLCDILFSKQQPKTILLTQLLFDIIKLWIPSYRFFSVENKSMVSNDIVRKIQTINFRF